MSSESEAPTSGEYIQHHLQNLTFGQHADGSWGIAHGAAEAAEMGFWAFHVDTLAWSLILGFSFFYMFRRIAKQANSGVDADQNRTADNETRKGENTKQNKKLRRQIMAQRREQLKPKRDQISKLEKDIKSLQENIDSLNTLLSDSQTYETESTASLSIMMQKKSGLEEQLKDLENRWFTATENLESLESSVKVQGASD